MARFVGRTGSASAELTDKLQAEIVEYLPRIVSLLNNTPQEKAIVRSAFLSVLATPSQSFSRKNELLTPVELMTLLHRSEKEVGLKNTIEGARLTISPSFDPLTSNLLSCRHLLFDARRLSSRGTRRLHAASGRRDGASRAVLADCQSALRLSSLWS